MASIDLRKLVFFVPPNLTKTFAAKVKLFNRVAAYIESKGGKVIRGDYDAMNKLSDDAIPVVGCTVQFANYIADWNRCGRTWIYWDRGYLRRGYYSTWLPKGADGGYYRWHINRSQMFEVYDVGDDRWKALQLDNQIKPWNKTGRQIVVINTMREYFDLWLQPNWIEETVDLLRQYTDRPIVVRNHESKVPLFEELKDAHCLVSHGSVAAIESVIFGCPVFVSDMSAARLVGLTDFSKIETPIYPERQPWLNSLAYCQYHEKELVDGTLWRLIR